MLGRKVLATLLGVKRLRPFPRGNNWLMGAALKGGCGRGLRGDSREHPSGCPRRGRSHRKLLPRRSVGEANYSRLPPRSSHQPPGRGQPLGNGALEGLWSSHAYLTYCPFQIDFNEALSAPHFSELKQFPSGILLKLLFNLKGR